MMRKTTKVATMKAIPNDIIVLTVKATICARAKSASCSYVVDSGSGWFPISIENESPPEIHLQNNYRIKSITNMQWDLLKKVL